ncbi:Ppx/GppA family phosphatase [Wielerella bovis]|uniref:Ppx/GppA phosphatase family protein n=1 Tax=Wielerella bovis TaxID=2917790 RepID=UPI00201963F3|nr:Ppx/GppA phosphatase family protein [Wielerella bovis]ULJ63131.1 Ppx/GppA family phosphatase [Wielerella bovis]
MNTLPMLATVDLGSNSFRLQICHNHNGQPQVIENIKYMVRLASGLDENKYLDEASQQRALECLAQFGERLRGFETKDVRAVATNTFRVAKNIGEFLPRAEAALGFPIEVVAGREEARLIYTGVMHTYANNGQKLLVVDIGGGSTEFILGSTPIPTHTESLPLGCITYSARFFSEKITQKSFQAAINAARSEIQRISKEYKHQGWDVALGTSGTAKSIAAVIGAQDMGGRITLAAMRVLADKIIAAGNVKKAKFEGLKPDRVDVFVGGLAVMMAAFEELDISGMAFNEAALRDGVFFEMIGRNAHEDLREQTAEQFQKRYHVGKNQAERVSKLALQFLRDLAQNATVQELTYWSDYVRWAAMLHEIGVSIAHTAYHKHTAYILANADMPGFSRQEQELLSLLALGQRGEIKKMADVLGNDVMRWHAVLALRLAVLFYRARLPMDLPPYTLLQYFADEQKYSLRIAKDWLDDEHPLISAALKDEREQWGKIGRVFWVEKI